LIAQVIFQVKRDLSYKNILSRISYKEYNEVIMSVKKREKAYRNTEFLNSPEARVIRILSEYLEPLKRFKENKVNNTVLFLGSARIHPDKPEAPLHRYYEEAEEIAFYLAQWAIKLKPKGKNFVICTGGGPGLMEAANRGASRAGGKSIGLNISLPHEQDQNPYVSSELSFIFHYFFMRKFWLANMARAIITFPGGFGTLDELFEILTLLQTGKINRKRIEVLLYGKDYWNKVVDFKELVRNQTISEEDLDLFAFRSDPESAFKFLKDRLIHFL
jgi:uncharacterized protein (TIGR00730 family)